MSWTPYFLWCDQATPATPPPPEEQLTQGSLYNNWQPRASCQFQRRDLLDQTPPRIATQAIWQQGYHEISSENNVRELQAWYTCTTHPGSRLRVFRQRAAYNRRFYDLIEHAYRMLRYGRDIPWPDFVEDTMRTLTRHAYAMARPKPRSTASLWN